MADNIMLSTTVSMNVHPMIRDSKVAKGELKSLNRALKAQSKAFKDTGMDAEGLAEKERLLTKATEAQNKVVEDSKKAYDEVLESIKDKNNMTNKEANAVSRTRGAYEAAKFEMKKYNNEIDRVKANQIQLASGTKELISAQKELELRNTRVVSSYKKMGDETGALRIQYKNLGNEINQNNKILSMEKATLEKLNGVISKTSSTYIQQEKAVEAISKKHTTLINSQNKVAESMTKLGVSYDNTTRRTGVLGRSFGALGTGMRGLMNAGARTSAMINRMGNSFRNVGLVIGGMAMGTLIQNFSTLVPLGGSLISVLAGVGGMAASLGGAAIGMGGAFGIAGIAVKLFAGQAKTALEMVEEGTMGSSAALTNYKNSLSALQDQWKGLVQANSGAIFTTMANGINIARYALTTLNPFITKTASQIASFSKRMRTWVTDSNNAGAAFNMLNKIGPRVFQNILNSIFKVTDGLAHMAVQFAPLFTYMAGGLEKMANSFNNWANSVSTDNGIAAFIEYTKTALPLTGQIFGNVFSGIISLFQAFSGHSVTVMRGMAGVTNTFKEWAANLSGTEGFKNFIAYLNENGPKAWQLLKNIGTIIVGVIKGLAPVGSFMLDVAVAVTGFVGSLVKANPVLGAFLGILSAVIGGIMAFAPPIMLLYQVLAPVVAFIGGLIAKLSGLSAIIAVLANPITWIVAGIVGLGAAFVIAYKQSETFRNIISGALRGVVVAFQWLWSGIKTVGGAIGSFIMNNIIGPIAAFGAKIGGQLSAFWSQNGPMIIQAVQNIWAVVGPILNAMFNFFKTVFIGIVGVVGSYLRMIWMVASPILTAFSQSFMAVWNFIKLQFQNVWNMIKGIVQGGLNVILGIVKIFGGVFTGNWSAVWSGLGQVVMGLLGIILAPIKFLFNTIKNALGLFGTVIKSVWFGIWGALKGVVVGTLGVISSVVRLVLGGIKTFFVWIWTSIKGIVLPIIQGIGTGISVVFNGIGKFIRWIFNGIASFIKWVWNGIKNSVMFYVNLIKSLVTAAWNILSRVTRAIFNGVKTFLIWVWQTIGVRVVNFVRSIWNGVKYYWNIVSSFTRTIFNAVKNFLIWVWTNIKNRVVSVVRVLWNNIRNNWNIISSFTRRIFNAVKNFLVWVWTNIKNRVVAVVRILWRNITTVWNTLSSTTRRIFNYIKDWLIWVWNNIKNRVVSLARGMWNIVRGVWNTISSVTRKIFNGIKNFLVWLWTTIRDKVVGFARSLWSKVSGTWNNLINGTKGIFNKVRNYLVDKWEGIRDKVTGIASDLWGKVKETFTNMKEGLKGLAGKIGDVITGMVKGIKKGLNSLIKGVNWVAEKLGVDKKIPQLSTGTGGTAVGPSGVGAGVSNGVVSSGGFATVNDRGPGNGSGPGGHQEVIQRANGTMVAPKGRDVTVPLGKGDIVHSGKAVQRAQKAGALPKFSRGTGNNNLLKDMKKKKKKKGDDEHGAFDAIGAFGPSGGGNKLQEMLVGNAAKGLKKTGDVANSGKKKVKSGAKTATNVAKAGAKSVGKIAGDLLEYVGNPGKLVSAMMDKFGVDFGKVKGEIPKDMMWNPMWKGLKGGVKSLFDGWLTEAEGAGDGGYIDLSKGINFGYAPSAAKAAAMGYPFPRAHHGIDVNYKMGEKLYSTMSGTATGKSGYNGGFGNSMWIKNGPLEAIYGHMSKLNWTGSKKVKPGSYLGKVGSTGDSTGPHLHYEMRRNGQHFNPIPWLKENDGGGKGGGKYGKQIKQALGMAGLPQSSKYIKAWQEQARTESTFNPKARNPSGASGLVQVKPATFGQYKLPGHGNIWNPLDNLIAGMRYAKARYGAKGMLNQIGHGLPYAKGTNNATRGLHPIHEKGGEIMNLRGGEQVIPNDVSIAALKQMMSSDLFSRTQAAVYAGISRYAEALEQKQEQKRIKELKAQQQANANTTDINELKSMMADMVYLMQQQLGVQENIAGTNNAIANKSNVMDLEKTTQKVSEQEAFNLLMSRYNSGLKMN